MLMDSELVVLPGRARLVDISLLGGALHHPAPARRHDRHSCSPEPAVSLC